MAFNKTCVVLLVLVLVVTIADARVDSFEGSLKSEKGDFCSTCECREEPKTTKCYRYDRKVGGCPLTCREPCACTRSLPPTCWCTYEVDTCTPKRCPPLDAAAKLENLLNFNGNN